MSQFKTESVGKSGALSGGFSKPGAGPAPARPGSVSASGASVLPTEPHPNPKPSDNAAQQNALDRWENEGGHPAVEPSREAIAKRAYEIYEESGCIPGRCEENWHMAERELKKLIVAKQDFKNKEE